MNIWKILEINPTENKQNIEKAYEALKLKAKYDDNIDLKELEIAYKYALEMAEEEITEEDFKNLEKDEKLSNETKEVKNENIKNSKKEENNKKIEKEKLENTQEIEKVNTEDEIDLGKTQELSIVDIPERESDKPIISKERSNVKKDTKDLNLMELSISKNFEDIININYWKEYSEKFKNTEGFIKTKITENLEKFIYNNFQVIPKDILFYIIENLKILQNRKDIIQKIEECPDYPLYRIDNLSYELNNQFFKLRYEAYYRLNYEYEDLKSIGKVFTAAEKIYNKDIDLKILKIAYGILEDIAFAQEDSLIFSKTTNYFDEVGNCKKDVYKYYKALINVYTFNQFDDIEIKDLDFENTDYIPFYLNMFLKGYIAYLVDNVDIAFEYWFKEEIGPAPKSLGSISRKLIIRKYKYLKEETQEDVKAMGLMDKTVSLSDIFTNIDLAYEFSNWRIIFETITPEELAKVKDKVIHYITNYYKILPKKTVKYIYDKVGLGNFEDLTISEKLEYEIDNIPYMTNYSIKASKMKKVEYYFNRYDYFVNSAILNRRKMSETLYKNLREITKDDIDVEVIRVQQLFFEDTIRDQGYTRTKNKINELTTLNFNINFEIYNIFIEAYNTQVLSKTEFNKFLIIDQEKLLIYKDVLNYINMFIYKLAGELEISEKYEKEIPNYFINKPKRKRNAKKKEQQELRKKALLMSVVTVLILVLLIVIIVKIVGSVGGKTSFNYIDNYFAVVKTIFIK